MKAILIHVPTSDTLQVVRLADEGRADEVARRFYWSLPRRRRIVVDLFIVDVYDEPAP